MLNIISSNEKPDFRYEKEAAQFFNNILSFGYALDTGDERYLCSEVKECIAENPDFLKGALRGMVILLVAATDESEVFKTREDAMEQLCLLQAAVDLGTEKKPSPEVENAFQTMRDRFVMSLLLSKSFQGWLKERVEYMEQERKGGNL